MKTQIQKKNAYALKEKDPNQESLAIFTRKELNPLGKLALSIFYGVLCIGIGFAVQKNKGSMDQSQVSNLSEKLSSLEAKLSRENDVIGMATMGEAIAQKVEIKMKNILLETVRQKDQKIKEQAEEIAELEYRLKNIVQAEVSKTVAPKDQVIPYSYANQSILSYEQRLERSRFIEKQKELAQNYMQTLNLKHANDQLKWQHFLDKQKIQLYAFEQKQSEERTEFRQNKFRVATAP